MKNEILMHKGIALWLAKYTKLTNQQIAEFCKMHEIEVSALRNGMVSIIEYNPIDAFILSKENIQKCEMDSNSSLKMLKLGVNQSAPRKNSDFIRKKEVDCAVLWILEKNSSISSSAIASLLPCTSSLVDKIKDKTYKFYEQIIPKHPVVLELCSQADLETLLAKYS